MRDDICTVCGGFLGSSAIANECKCIVPEFIDGDCFACGDEEQLLVKSEDETEPIHYVCKECFLRGL